jgi:putative hydrolase of the HAD superfamily
VTLDANGRNPATRPFRAVLFDVGGPIDTEIEHERHIDASIVAALASEGYAADDEALARASATAVANFAPHTYAAMIMELVRRDVAAAARVTARFRARAAARLPELELREGIDDLMRWLYGNGLLIGLAANQPATVLSLLDAHGIGRYLHHRGVSGTHGYRKPDVRLFLHACYELDVTPADCIMVGDRVDNDIVPARLLGMATILFRTGRHIDQQPRSVEEVPDVEVTNVPELRVALGGLLAARPRPVSGQAGADPTTIQ